MHLMILRNRRSPNPERVFREMDEYTTLCLRILGTMMRHGKWNICDESSSWLEHTDQIRGTFQIFSTAIPRIVLGLILLYRLVGWPALVGAVLSGISCFILERVNRATLTVQHESRRAADDRISQTSEMLSSIRMVKYHGWEKLFFENICARRLKEVRLIFRRNLYTACIEVTTAIVPRASILIVLLLYTKVKHEKLSVSVAFTLVTLFDIIRDSFSRSCSHRSPGECANECRQNALQPSQPAFPIF